MGVVPVFARRVDATMLPGSDTSIFNKRPVPKSLTTRKSPNSDDSLPMPFKNDAPVGATEPNSSPVTTSKAKMTLFRMANRDEPSTSMPCVAPPLPKVSQEMPSSAVTKMLLPAFTNHRLLLGSYSTDSTEERV